MISLQVKGPVVRSGNRGWPSLSDRRAAAVLMSIANATRQAISIIAASPFIPWIKHLVSPACGAPHLRLRIVLRERVDDFGVTAELAVLRSRHGHRREERGE